MPSPDEACAGRKRLSSELLEGEEGEAAAQEQEGKQQQQAAAKSSGRHDGQESTEASCELTSEASARVLPPPAGAGSGEVSCSCLQGGAGVAFILGTATPAAAAVAAGEQQHGRASGRCAGASRCVPDGGHYTIASFLPLRDRLAVSEAAGSLVHVYRAHLPVLRVVTPPGPRARAVSLVSSLLRRQAMVRQLVVGARSLEALAQAAGELRWLTCLEVGAEDGMGAMGAGGGVLPAELVMPLVRLLRPIGKGKKGLLLLLLPRLKELRVRCRMGEGPWRALVEALEARARAQGGQRVEGLWLQWEAKRGRQHGGGGAGRASYGYDDDEDDEEEGRGGEGGEEEEVLAARGAMKDPLQRLLTGRTGAALHSLHLLPELSPAQVMMRRRMMVATAAVVLLPLLLLLILLLLRCCCCYCCCCC